MGRKSENYSSIIKTASHVFWIKGYESTGVNEICSLAGINKGTLYHFFKNKEEIAIAIIDTNFKEVNEFINNNNHIPNHDQIIRYFNMVVDSQRKEFDNSGIVPGCPFGNLGLEMSSRNNIIRNKIIEWLNFMVAFLEKRLRTEYNTKANYFKLAENLFTHWQGALLISKASNSLRPLDKAKLFTKKYLRNISIDSAI